MSSAIESKKLSLQIVSHCDKYFKIYLYQDVTALKKLVLHNPVSVLTISRAECKFSVKKKKTCQHWDSLSLELRNSRSKESFKNNYGKNFFDMPQKLQHFVI